MKTFFLGILIGILDFCYFYFNQTCVELKTYCLEDSTFFLYKYFFLSELGVWASTVNFSFWQNISLAIFLIVFYMSLWFILANLIIGASDKLIKQRNLS